MKVQCINNSFKDNVDKNKLYDVISISSNCYKLMDDTGNYNWFSKKRFITLSLSRKLKLEKIKKIKDETKIKNNKIR